MVSTLIIILFVVIGVVIGYRQLDRKKYDDSTYLSNLREISLFFDTIQQFDDYVTWVERDRLKIQFSAVGPHPNKSSQ